MFARAFLCVINNIILYHDLLFFFEERSFEHYQRCEFILKVNSVGSMFFKEKKTKDSETEGYLVLVPKRGKIAPVLYYTVLNFS